MENGFQDVRLRVPGVQGSMAGCHLCVSFLSSFIDVFRGAYELMGPSQTRSSQNHELHELWTW